MLWWSTWLAFQEGNNRSTQDAPWNKHRDWKTSIDFTYRQGLYTTADVEARALENYCSSSVAEME
jgi:hypothetical protein